jgi:MFS family permease
MPPTNSPINDTSHQAQTLANKTFIGLLIAQFLAAFNDQAIHASAMFFAINKKTLTEASAISLMPILFYAPWAIFCTLAGYLADRYSKRNSLIFWKLAEVGITLLTLVGFVVGNRVHPVVGSWIVLSTVFLMGTHSAFFVPAKYGAMPEILAPHLLSKGNGLLESLSFLAVILGTVCGGLLSFLFQDREGVIGIILMVLAIVGAAASYLIQPMPAANPTRPFPAYLYGPLWRSLKTLFTSRPLTFAIVGIAFFTFIVAFMRAAVYMLGESRMPRWNELQTSAVVGMTALGIGLGSPLAGWMSGKKVELGLIPIGAFGMVFATCCAAYFLDRIPYLVGCIVMIGFSTGFYLVPLFTQLQHRAPKESKGDVVAMSNFINVSGAIAASILFFVLVAAAHNYGVAPLVAQTDRHREGRLDRLFLDNHHRPFFFVVVDELGIAFEGGDARKLKAPDVDALQSAFFWIEDEEPIESTRKISEQVILSRKALRAYQESGENRRPAVIVSMYNIRGIIHYHIRLYTEPLPPVFDNIELPRYLFMGAAVMTLITLLLLIAILRDLIRRSIYVLRTVGRSRLHVFGTHHLPGRGPTLLITEAVTAADIERITQVSDRPIHFVDPAVPWAMKQVIDLLKSSQVVGWPLTDKTDASTSDLVKEASRHLGDALTILTVFCGIDEVAGGPEVVFGDIVAPDESLKVIKERLRSARKYRGE